MRAIQNGLHNAFLRAQSVRTLNGSNVEKELTKIPTPLENNALIPVGTLVVYTDTDGLNKIGSVKDVNGDGTDVQFGADITLASEIAKINNNVDFTNETEYFYVLGAVKSGLVIKPHPTIGQALEMSSGVIINKNDSIRSFERFDILAQTQLTFDIMTQDGSIISTGNTTLDPNQLNTTGNAITTLPNNTVAVMHEFYINTAGNIVCLIAQSTFTNIGQARQRFLFQRNSVPSSLDNYIQIGNVIVRANDTNYLTDSNVYFIETNKLGEISTISGSSTPDVLYKGIETETNVKALPIANLLQGQEYVIDGKMYVWDATVTPANAGANDFEPNDKANPGVDNGYWRLVSSNADLVNTDIEVGEIWWSLINNPPQGVIMNGETFNNSEYPDLAALAPLMDAITDNGNGTSTVNIGTDFLRPNTTNIGNHIDDTTAPNGLFLRGNAFDDENSGVGGSTWPEFTDTTNAPRNRSIEGGGTETAPNHKNVYVGIWGKVGQRVVNSELVNAADISGLFSKLNEWTGNVGISNGALTTVNTGMDWSGAEYVKLTMNDGSGQPHKVYEGDLSQYNSNTGNFLLLDRFDNSYVWLQNLNLTTGVFQGQIVNAAGWRITKVVLFGYRTINNIIRPEDLTITNSSTATAGQVLTANGDGTFTFI